MTPVGSKAIPQNPVCFNLLARSQYGQTKCRICNYPGHQSPSLANSRACHAAIMSTIDFWADMAVHISMLYSLHEPFHKAIVNNEPAYAMRLDTWPMKGRTYEEIFVERLAANYLKFQSHFAGIRPKAKVMLTEEEMKRYEDVTGRLDDYLLKGRSCMLQRLLICFFFLAGTDIGVVSDLFQMSLETGKEMVQ
jgi:CCR4-NOT transcription complex subunit 2